MKIGRWAGLLAAAMLLAGCGNFWQAPGGNGASFTLTSNPTSITMSTTAASTGTSTISVTPASTFTGTVTLTCAVTSAPSGVSSSNYPTCGLSPTSLTFSSATAQPSTLTTTNSSSPATGGYVVTVTGASSGVVAETTTVCVVVGSGTCSSSASTSGKFYILSNVTGTTFQVVSYSITSGQLTALSSPAALSGQAYSMAIDPTGNFLYVGTNGGILLYKIGSGGTLTLNQSWISTNTDPSAYALAVDSTGQWLLDASNSGPTLYAYPISPSTGLSTLGSNINVPSKLLISGGSVGVGGLAISPDKSLVAVAVGSATQTVTFSAGSGGNGSVSPFTGTVSTTTAKGTAVSVAFDTQTRFLYIGETGVPALSTSGGLRMISITSDVPGNDVSGSPYASGGTNPHAILTSSNGYVYVANYQGTGNGVVTEFLLSASTPSLTQQSNTVSTGVAPYGMTVDSTGDFVLVVNNQGTSPLSAFTFDATTTSKLDPYSLSGSLGAGPVAIVAAPK